MALTLPEIIDLAVPVEPDKFFGRNVWDAGADPTVSDDQTAGYEPGSFWYRVVNPVRMFVCTDSAAGAAVWRRIDTLETYFASTVSAVASETLSSGNMVNLWNDGGTLKVRKANATDNTKPCDGFVIGSVTSGASGSVFVVGGLSVGLFSGLTIGDEIYLSTTAGAITATAPSTSGNIVQRLGKAVSASTIIFNRSDFVEVA